MSFLYFWSLPAEQERHVESTWSETERDRKDVASDLEPDETRHMMCPSNPTTWQDSTNTPAFSLFLVFTSISFCNIVSAWSCLPWPTVSFFCRSGKGLAWRFHALFSVSPFASDEGGVPSQNFVFSHPRLFAYDFCTGRSSLLDFLPRLPSSLNSLSSWPLFVITLSHPPLLLRASFSISGSPRCLLGMVSCHLCRMTWVVGETPPV